MRLEEDVAIDGESDAGVSLDTTEASCRIVSQICFFVQIMGRELTCASGRGVVHVRAWYDSLVGSDAESDAGEGCRAGESISTLRADVLGTRYLGIVGGDGCLWEIKQSSSGISDGVDRSCGEGTSADSVAIASEFPETVGRLYWNVGDSAGVFSGIDVAEVVAARCALLQVCSEEGSSQGWNRVAEEGLQLVWGGRVDGVESKTEQTVTVDIGLELRTDCLCKLDSLAGNGGCANLDGIEVDIA